MEKEKLTYVRLSNNLGITAMATYGWVKKPHKLNLMKIIKLEKALNLNKGTLIEWILETL